MAVVGICAWMTDPFLVSSITGMMARESLTAPVTTIFLPANRAPGWRLGGFLCGVGSACGIEIHRPACAGNDETWEREPQGMRLSGLDGDPDAGGLDRYAPAGGAVGES